MNIQCAGGLLSSKKVGVIVVEMAKNKRSKSFLWSQKANQNGMKILLGLLATGSFAMAFGQEKISQWATNGTSTNTACLNQFYRDVPPYLAKASLQKDSYPLCFNGFNVMYSGVSKTPLWVAEYLNPKRLATKIKREDNFHEETRVPERHRALLSDYRASGYDRGHMAPNADMGDTSAQYDSFSLANMVPQAPKNNQQVWRELEEATRAIVSKHKQDVYVVTGPIFSGKKLKTIGQGVIVPTAVYKAIYLPKTGAIGAYYAPNNNSLQIKVVSVCYLEEQLGMNLFPQLTEEQKRNTYKLPLNATAVKAGKKLEYSHWDAESQCAEDIGSEQIKQTQQQFGQQKTGTATGSDENGSSPSPENAAPSWIKQLLTMLLQFLLQFLK